MPPEPTVAAESSAQATITFGSPGSMTRSEMVTSPVVSGGMLPPLVTVSLVKVGEADVAFVER